MALEHSHYYMDIPDLTQQVSKANIPGGNINASDDDLWLIGWGALWVDNPLSPGYGYVFVEGGKVVNDVDKRVEQFNSWALEDPAVLREKLSDQIEFYMEGANESQISLRADPGRIVLLDEAISIGKREQGRLDLTADDDLAEFELNFDPTTVGSIDTSKTLYAQTSRVLQEDPTLTEEERGELEVVQGQYATIAQGSDDAAPVPPIPSSSRRRIGVTGESFGTIRFRRFLDGVYWRMEFLLTTKRELKTGDYWIALYNEAGTYLSTPQLTDMGGGKYYADKDAVGNAQNTDQLGFQYTLCFQHITNPQFARVVVKSGVHTQIDKVRWNGNTASAVRGRRGSRGRSGK